MTNSQPHFRKPTEPQIEFLCDLTDATGETFAWPQTFKKASEEIVRLLEVKRTRSADRRRETDQVRHDMATARGDAAAFRDDELGGYGSSAHWR